MINVKRDFQDRVDETELYFSFMNNLMLKDAILKYPDDSTEAISVDLLKIFKANSFLILYNLSESCIKNAVKEIYLTLHNTNVSYDQLSNGIKKEILSYFKKNVNAKDFVSSVNQIAFDIILKCFNSENLLSGNLDAREIRKLANSYGFSHSILPITNSDGSFTNVDSSNLLTVKTQRNDLAHGTFSFKECGRNYSFQDLEKIKNHVIEYLNQILNNIEIYITNENYLSVAT